LIESEVMNVKSKLSYDQSMRNDFGKFEHPVNKVSN